MVETRKRNWAFIIYPEGNPPAPEDWKEQLQAQFVPGFVSPLHDADQNADETEKKAHWHVMLMFKGLKSLEQVKEISDLLNGTIPQPVKDIRAYARYLCHLDNPEKAQYQPGDVISLCGADYLANIKSASDTDTAVGEMMDWVAEQGCYSFAKLAQYARANRPDWFRVLTSKRTVFMSAFIKSLAWTGGEPKRDSD